MQYFTRQLSHETTPAPALVCVEIPRPNKSLEFSNLEIDVLLYSQYKWECLLLVKSGSRAFTHNNEQARNLVPPPDIRTHHFH